VTFANAALRLRARLDALPGNLRGVLWVLAGGFMLTLMFAAIKFVIADVPPFVATLFRTLVAFLLVLPWLASVGRAGIATKRIGMHFLRTLAGIGSFACIVFAMQDLILSDAIVLSFSYPLWSIIIVGLAMGERVRARRTIATVVGFAGVVLVVQPHGGVEPAALLAIASALLTTLALITVKSLTRTEPPERIVFYFFFFGVLILIVPALLTWKTPSWEHFAWLAAAGVCGVVGQTWMTRAYRAAEITVIQPIDFLRIPMAAAMGFLLFGEVPNLVAGIGTGVIMVACYYIARREARLRRDVVRAPQPPVA